MTPSIKNVPKSETVSTTSRDNDVSRSSKGDRTRDRILDAATTLFATHGYEGTSIRHIEQKAGVNRGLVTYHFGNKDSVWKATFDYAFLPYLDDLRSKADLLRELDERTRLRLVVGNFVRTSAKRPYMNQLMIQENYELSWRSDWIVEHYLKPAAELNREIGGDDAWVAAIESNPHLRYVLLGSCVMPFSLSSEARALYDTDVSSDAFIHAHIEIVLQLIEPLFDSFNQ